MYGFLKVLAKGKSAVPLWSQGDKENKTENIDAYGIVFNLIFGFFCKKHCTKMKQHKNYSKDMDKHSGAQSKWEQGAVQNDTSSQHDTYGIVKVKGMDKHSGAQSKWEQGALQNDTSSQHDSYGIVKVKGMDKHSGAQSKWEQGALRTDTSSQHDSYGIVKVKGTDRHSGVQSKWEEGSLATDTSSKHDSYGIIKNQQLRAEKNCKSYFFLRVKKKLYDRKE
ncbi:hypothetical protein RFI_11431 [Reticulomyxa filosa]|uniref:Uncharacterized protein n=1 Tax=Reticulomyxa filosa TaxID=46433 RepID=X6NHA9_RETFI|nr:hypothetical protein RFI_11431 [Reticulomyxa filosa]|eukprot:ETO25705.1 hypothetical protein RFI_11431 [Reticulomyxa filosa]